MDNVTLCRVIFDGNGFKNFVKILLYRKYVGHVASITPIAQKPSNFKQTTHENFGALIIWASKWPTNKSITLTNTRTNTTNIG